MTGKFQHISDYARCILLVTKICRSRKSASLLLGQLEELEREIRAAKPSLRCPSCGATELEPLLEAPSQGEVTSFRCKACGGQVGEGRG